MRFCSQLKYAAVVAGLLMAISGFSYAGSLKATTEQGKVKGKTINDGKVRAFLGIPYAAPPVGDLRWKAPQPSAKWKGTRDATSYGSRCLQGREFDDMVFQDSGPSEDCLFLNIYTPAESTDSSKLPVMFWIHGGGYTGGASSEPRHNGDFLPLKGVVLVTINYRLGVFGFLTTEDLAKEAGGTAGNYGLMDMVAALHWVKSNIKKFGGDSNNVTIFGESAGSFAVSTLMASPMAKGLFQRAIGESGGAFPSGRNLGGKTVAERAKTDGAWVDSLGVKSLMELRALPANTILEAATKTSAPEFASDVDGKLLTESVPDAYAAGRQAHVLLLAGWNADEGSGSAVDGMTVAEWKDRAQAQFTDRAPEFLKLYPGETDAEALRSAIDFEGDSFIAFGTWKWVEAHRKTGDSPVYRYHFELPAPPSKYHAGSFAFHSDDIEYVFGTLATRPGAVWRAKDWKLSDEIMSYWTNFAKNGDPNGPGLPEWPKYGKDDTLIHLNDPITAAPDALRPRYEFLLEGIPPKHF